MVPCIERCTNAQGDLRRFAFRCCTVAELPAIAALQEQVIRALPDARLFARTGEAELYESLRADFCLGAFAEEELAMVAVMVVNRPTPRSLGRHLGYDDARALRTVTLDTMFVAPRFRGYGLQRRALELAEERARALGADEMLATVSPENGASLRNFRAAGFSAADRQRLYGGLDRFILRKALTEPAAP